jgi:RecA-family ATPase
MGNLQSVKQQFTDPIGVIGDLSRAVLCAAPGHRLLIADFSGVESRITAYLSGQQSKVDAWALFDSTKDKKLEPYYQIGKRLGQSEETARSIGKTADLAFGYSGGVGAWRRLAHDSKLSDAEIDVLKNRWRDAHPQTVKFWNMLSAASVRAVQRPGTTVPCGRVSFAYDGTFLRMKLPSGRSIAYPQPHLETNEYGKPVVWFKDNSKGFKDERAWRGLLIENAVQGVARDVFAEALIRLEGAGYPVVLHVHDEIVCELPIGIGSTEEFQKLMTAVPEWAGGLPIAAEPRESQRFIKIKAPKIEAPGATGSAPVPPAATNSTPEPEILQQNEQTPPWEVEKEIPMQPITNGKGGHIEAPPIVPVVPLKVAAPDRTRHSSDGNVHGDTGPQRGRRTAQFFYPHLDRSEYLRVDRYDGVERKFFQHHWDGKQWVLGVKGTYAERKIPYRLPELKAALQVDPNVQVHITEGESDADALARLGFVVTTNPGGALSWTPELTNWLRVLGVQNAVIHEDNDGEAHGFKGQKRTELLIRELSGFIKLKVVRYPDVDEGEDVRWWLEHDHHTKEELEARIAAAGSAALPFPFINMANWDYEPVPEQEWCVPDRIPRRQSVIFSGEGGAGKSTILLHLTATTALSREWLGALPEQGPAFFIDCEDDEKVMHYRLAAIARHMGVCITDLINGGLRLTSLVGQDTVMATVSRSGVVEPTPLYNRLSHAVGDIKPSLIGIAASANVFAGNENDRSQVQQFVNLTTRLAMLANGATVLITHPSNTGIASGTGLSGSTQWHNAVRARFYLKGVKAEPGEQPDNDLREIEFKKNQYGALAESIPLRWQDGMYLPIDGATFNRAEQEARADDVFLELLRRFNTENRRVSSSLGPTYAPALFAKEDAAKKAGVSNAGLTAAMRRLFKVGKIHNESHGKSSRQRFHLAIKP